MWVELSDKSRKQGKVYSPIPLMDIKNTFTAKQHCRLNKDTHIFKIQYI